VIRKNKINKINTRKQKQQQKANNNNNNNMPEQTNPEFITSGSKQIIKCID